MLWRQPFVIHVRVGQLDIFVTHRVVELHQDFHFRVIDGRGGLLFYADL